MNYITQACLGWGLLGLIFGFGFGFLAGILAQYHRIGEPHTRESDEHEDMNQ